MRGSRIWILWQMVVIPRVSSSGPANIWLTVKVEDFRRVFDVNVIGVLLCYRTAAAAMIKCNTAKGGRIIGACSMVGKRGIYFLVYRRVSPV
jgi:NAD(P)-dependent dehydrogenase (short-subunit alcohol dehydrogenase family)